MNLAFMPGSLNDPINSKKIVIKTTKTPTPPPLAKNSSLPSMNQGTTTLVNDTPDRKTPNSGTIETMSNDGSSD